MRLSVVTTLYNSAAYVEEFYARMSAAARQLGEDYEMIFVNDGSPDTSLDKALGLSAGDPKVVVVDLSRNFGHHHAILAGLAYARGERVFLIDVDLEEQPEWLADFAREMDRAEVDVVFGVQRSRTGNRFNVGSGVVFYKLFNLLSDTKIPENACTVRLMRREYVGAVLDMGDSNLFLAGVFQWAGFKQKSLVVQKRPRSAPSSYTLLKRVALSINAVTSFTSYPLTLISLTGLGITGLFGLIGLALIVNKLLNPSAVLVGWPSLIVSIWFLGGLIIAFIGIVGMYLAKIFAEVKRRPRYVVRKVHWAGQTPQAPSPSLRAGSADPFVAEVAAEMQENLE